MGLTPASADADSVCAVAPAGAASGAVSQVASAGLSLVGIDKKIIGPMTGSTAETPATSGRGCARVGRTRRRG